MSDVRIDRSALIHKYGYNGILRSESIPTNNECGVPHFSHAEQNSIRHCH